MPTNKHGEVSPERAAFAAELRRRMKERYSTIKEFAAAIGASQGTVQNWLGGWSAPTELWAERIRERLGDFPIPFSRSNYADLDERLAELRVEQCILARKTGRVPTYTLWEIGGDIISKERVQQIEEVALRKLALAMATTPGYLRDIGITPADIRAAI